MSDPIVESAKATQGVAKTTSKGLEVIEGLGGWLDRVFGEGIEHSVKSIWTNKISARSIASAIHSWERLELLLHKTKKRLREKGVKRSPESSWCAAAHLGGARTGFASPTIARPIQALPHHAGQPAFSKLSDPSQFGL